VNNQTDQDLLRDYATCRSEAAFAELVRRHIDLVHSAAVRMVCDAHLAQDVTQATFVALAQNANHLADRAVLSSWLHRTAQNLASKTVRTDVRRRQREQEAVVMNELLSATPDVPWEQIAPHLDAAIGELSEPERDAVLLRYFEKKSAVEIGGTLGISAEAAQKRVSRAVERLRDFFAKRGVTVGASGLVVVISANAVQAAPVSLAVTISAAALAGTAATTSTLIATTKTIAMTTLQKTLITATVAALAGAGIYEARQAAQLRDQVQTLQQQQAPLAEQIQQLQGELENASNRVVSMAEELANTKRNNAELLKLRGEVTLLRRQVKAAEASAVNHQAMASSAPAPAATNQSAISDHPKETWNYAGYATPEDALQTWTWAMSKSDQETMLSSLTPESRKQWEQIFASQPAAGVGMKGLGKIAGYKIVDSGLVSESEAWVAISMTESKPSATEPRIMKMILKKVGSDWKVSGPSQN